MITCSPKFVNVSCSQKSAHIATFMRSVLLDGGEVSEFLPQPVIYSQTPQKLLVFFQFIVTLIYPKF
jgi:hypothetical protein